MGKWLGDLDRILRGEATRPAQLRDGMLETSASGLTAWIILLGMFYGLCMGSFAWLNDQAGGWQQIVASMVKVPALFLLTLLVTFPSLYVFNALIGSRLTLLSLWRLLIAALAVMLALLASFGTIVAFFSFTTDSYPFMVVLNVAVYAFCGFLGLSFLLQTLHRLTLGSGELAPLPAPVVTEPAATAVGEEAEPTPPPLPPGALDWTDERAVGRNVKLVFKLWVIVFGLVGAQMSWVLRPFIGSTKEFALFRPRGSNFFEGVFHHLQHLLGGW